MFFNNQASQAQTFDKINRHSVSQCLCFVTDDHILYIKNEGTSRVISANNISFKLPLSEHPKFKHFSSCSQEIEA